MRKSISNIRRQFIRHFVFILYEFLSHIFIVLSNIPLFIRILRTPSGWVFPLVHFDWVHDYDLYLAAIIQGMNHQILYQDPFTSEKLSPGIFYLTYGITGFINSFFHLWPPIAYHLLRFLTLEIFIIASFLIIVSLFQKKIHIILAGFLSLVVGINPYFVIRELQLNHFLLPGGVPWWIALDPLERLNQLPHYLLSFSFMLLSVWFLFRYRQTYKILYSFVSSICIFISGIVQPSSVIPFLTGSFFVILTTVIQIKKTKITQKKLKHCVGFFLILLAALGSTAVIKYSQNTGFPWSMYTSWLVGRWNNLEVVFDNYLILSTIVLLLLSIPGMYYAIRFGSQKQRFIVGWLVSPFLILPFANIFQIPKIYLIDQPWFVAWGIILTISVLRIAHFFKSSRRVSFFVVFIFFLISLSSVVSTGFILATRIHYLVSEPIYTNPYWSLIFIHPATKDSISALCDIASNNSLILARPRISNILPASCKVRTYIGHMNQTLNYTEKEKKTDAFFMGTMNSDEAKKFLQSERIQYVYLGSDEKWGNPSGINYVFLDNVYKNNDVSIFQVR